MSITKTKMMLEVEKVFEKDIVDILTSGPLKHHYNTVLKDGRCGNCVECNYGINKSTQIDWRKRLAIRDVDLATYTSGNRLYEVEASPEYIAGLDLPFAGSG